MSTLAQIEAAVRSLTLQELERLEQEVQALRLQRVSELRPNSSNSRVSATIRLPHDPLEWQRQVRAEWG